MLTAAPSFQQKINNHFEDLKINNRRILAQFKAELRRFSLNECPNDKDKYQSTCMETINERSKEAEGDSYSKFPPRNEDKDLQLIFDHPPEIHYVTNQQKYDSSALQKKLRKSPGWTISATRQSYNPVDRREPQIQQFCHIYDEI